MKGWGETSWEVSLGKKGKPMLTLGGLLIHSRYDPEGQALKTAKALLEDMTKLKASFLVLFGHGLGYLPKALNALGVEKLIIWEPLAQVFSGLCDRARVVPHEKVVCTYSAFMEATKTEVALGERPMLAVHPGYAPFCRFEYRLVSRLFEKGSGKQRLLPQAVISQRALQSLARIPSLQPMIPKPDCFADQTALIVTTGPSLEAVIPLLQRRKGGVVFAAFQAILTLQQAGIEVDVAIAPDPIDYFADCLHRPPDPPGLLLAETGAHPTTLDWIPEQTWLFHFHTDQLYHFYWQESGHEIIDEPVATVSETMLLLASRLGFSQIALLGMDFCWRETRYSDTHQKDLSHISDCGEVQFPIKCASGTAQTHSVYFQAARCMDYLIQKSTAQRICQYTQGRPVAGAEQLELSELADLLEQTHPFSGPDKSTPPTTHGNKTAARDLLERAQADHQPVVPGGGVSVAIQETLPPFFHELPESDRANAISRCHEQLSSH